jgi:hypothetical protein
MDMKDNSLLRPEQPAAAADAAEEEWAVETSCYLCYAQCVNFGVHGKGGRPCAKGVSDYINQRHRLRRDRRAAAAAATSDADRPALAKG